MPDDPRLIQKLSELLDSTATPEEVCRSCPELLTEVRERWRQVCQTRAELDAIFPPFAEFGIRTSTAHGIPLPRIVGYEVDAVLGQGGMGVVFHAHHVRLNRIVALKMMLAGAYASPIERERFQREAEAVAGLRHQNVVQIYDVGDSDGRAFFTMEYIEGGSLARKLDGTPQSPRDAAALVASLASAIQAAHLSGIVHRDLKPSNVLLSADGTPKVSDFGLSRRLDDDEGLTRTGATVGTPSYMAPEQASGGTVGSAVDIYALGAILYELLTGVPPFRGGTAADTIQQVISREPVAPSKLNAKVPRDLEIICLKTLNKEPALRYDSASALGEDLGRFLRGEAIAARPEGQLERLTRRIRRRPKQSATIVFGTLLTCGLLGGGAWLLAERAAIARAIDAEQTAAKQTAEMNLQEMVVAMNDGAWGEARAALERAKAWLGNIEAEKLKLRIEQANRDLKLTARLDSIRLTAHTDIGNVLSLVPADEAYEVAFREGGFGQVGDSAKVTAARVNHSNIRNALLAALDNWPSCTEDAVRRHWLVEVTQEADGESEGWRARVRDSGIWKDEAALYKLITEAPIPEQSAALLLATERQSTAPNNVRLRFLQRLQDAHPRDFWVNLRLGMFLDVGGKSAEAIGYYQAAVAAQPDVAIVHNNLGLALYSAKRYDESLAHYRKCVHLAPTAANGRTNYAEVLSATGLHQAAIEHARAAIQLGDKGTLVHSILGRSLEALGSFDEAIDQHRQAMAIEPKNRISRDELRRLLMGLQRTEELQAIWSKEIDETAPIHENWYGYAELCLFLGREEEYLKARRNLLAAFGVPKDPMMAERVSRACLLLPASGEDLDRAVALAEYAGAEKRQSYSAIFIAFKFVKGLAEFRKGNFAQTIPFMEEANGALGPCPRLVIAMSQHQLGRTDEARRTLAGAIASQDWRADKIRDQDGWIWHIIRREAERMIVPDLAKLIDGTREPRDNDERLTMLGSFQFANRFEDVTRLYEEASHADPNLMSDLPAAHRHNAARFAALAGCDRGSAKSTESDRARWRLESRMWLTADLAIYRGSVEQYRDWVRKMVKRCLETSDLAGLREASELEKLAPEERSEWRRLWDDFRTLEASL
jgi:tetratricopeptide (TPR) repeat protein/predicted Ser/Thr protein kinase